MPHLEPIDLREYGDMTIEILRPTAKTMEAE